MASALKLLFLTVAVLAAPAQHVLAASQPPLGADDDDDTTLNEILSKEGVPDTSDDLSVDVDRWVLHDVLRRGFAQTRSWEDEFDRDNEAPLVQMRQQTWLEALENNSLLARLRGLVPTHHLDVAKLHFDIPLSNHPLVDVYVDYFTGRGRWFFEKWLERAPRYVPVMQQILEAKGVPKDLVYLAMVESGFSAKAISTAAASGYWQFMGPTGRSFGLANDSWIDERRDFIRATEAAADYLGRLYRDTGDWHLAWASYNAGEGRVRRAMEKYGSTDFWELIEHKDSLAKETMHYVPKIIAAAIVAKDAEKYGFGHVSSLKPMQYDEIQVKDCTDLRFVARKTGSTLELLRDLNPALLHDVTPPNRTMMLRVPRGQGTTLAALLEGMPRQKRLVYTQHKVRRGDTLAGIARRYGVEVATIVDFNGLQGKKSLHTGEQLIVPSIKAEKRQSLRVTTDTQVARVKGAAPVMASRVKLTPPKKRGNRHTVAAGETLWSIARRYGVSVDHIKKGSKRRNSQLAIGDVLEIL